jgi:branched-subunit amino acid transport protein
MAAVTFLPRFLPMALLSRFSLPVRLKETMGYMPAAIISAILFPILFSTTDAAFAIDARLLWSAVPVIFLCSVYKKIWLAVLVGMLTYWILGSLG